MGKSLVAIGAIASAASAAASVVGGISQASAANQQAKNAQQEAEAQARIEARNNIEAEARQKVAFLSSGVSLEGSPLVVLQETQSRGDVNIDNIIDSGERQASSISSSGRQALFGGLTSAAGTAVGGFQDFKAGS